MRHNSQSRKLTLCPATPLMFNLKTYEVWFTTGS